MLKSISENASGNGSQELDVEVGLLLQSGPFNRFDHLAIAEHEMRESGLDSLANPLSYGGGGPKSSVASWLWGAADDRQSEVGQDYEYQFANCQVTETIPEPTVAEMK